MAFFAIVCASYAQKKDITDENFYKAVFDSVTWFNWTDTAAFHNAYHNKRLGLDYPDHLIAHFPDESYAQYDKYLSHSVTLGLPGGKYIFSFTPDGTITGIGSAVVTDSVAKVIGFKGIPKSTDEFRRAFSFACLAFPEFALYMKMPKEN